MSQALRIDPTMIATYSAKLFIDRSERFGADTPNNAFVSLQAGWQAVPISKRIGADVSDRLNVDFYADGQPIGGFDFHDAHQEEWWKKIHEVGEFTVVSCRDTNTLVHAPTWGEGMTDLIADEARIVRIPLVLRAYENGVGTSAPGQ